MILPIVAYGDPVLKKVAQNIDPEYPGLKELISNMYDTMYHAKGVGLAAPQVGVSIRLFVIDGAPYEEDTVELSGFKKVFINARRLHEEGEEWLFNEGCLSIPDIREEISRKETILLIYLDEDFIEHTEIFSGIAARIIMHEYDHIDGKLFTDYLSPLKKRMLKNRLESITKGEIKVDYNMKFPHNKKTRKN